MTGKNNIHFVKESDLIDIAKKVKRDEEFDLSNYILPGETEFEKILYIKRVRKFIRLLKEELSGEDIYDKYEGKIPVEKLQELYKEKSNL